MTMTRSTYEKIAAVIKTANEEVPDGPMDALDSGYQCAVEDIAINLAKAFKEDNPRFNESIFFTACTLPDMRIPS